MGARVKSGTSGSSVEHQEEWLFLGTMKTKSLAYPAVIVASLLGLLVLVLGSLQFTISIEQIEPETSSLPEETVPATPRSLSGEPRSTIPRHPTPESKPTEPVEQETPPVSTPEPAGRGVAVGTLRMSNQTDQPVRVALLARLLAATSGEKPGYSKPAHWDFAPGEGSAKGLILSLPEGNLKLKKGDILVAFAQDGSRRYWGPYVVGETASPVWNRQTAEWQLILQP